jgi:hypothetical protein
MRQLCASWDVWNLCCFALQFIFWSIVRDRRWRLQMMCFVSCNEVPATFNRRICVWPRASYNRGQTTQVISPTAIHRCAYWLPLHSRVSQETRGVQPFKIKKLEIYWTVLNHTVLPKYVKITGQAVAHCVEALWNKPEGPGLDSRWGHRIFSWSDPSKSFFISGVGLLVLRPLLAYCTSPRW